MRNLYRSKTEKHGFHDYDEKKKIGSDQKKKGKKLGPKKNLKGEGSHK